MSALLVAASTALAGATPSAGPARAEAQAGALILENGAITCEWRIEGDTIRPHSIVNRLTGAVLDVAGAQLFQLVLAGGRFIRASDLGVVGSPKVERLAPDRRATRLSPRSAGRRMTVNLASPDGRVTVIWRASLRDGAQHTSQELEIRALGAELPLVEVVPLEIPSDGAAPAGEVDGSPLARGDLWAAVEHPMTRITVEPTFARIRLPRPRPLRAGESVVVTSAVGVAIPGQLRRAFRAYVESERAHPHRPFLHYNSWFDIAWAGRKMTEPECVASVDAVGRELVARRRVTVDAFVFDDGWDDETTLWEVDAARFPRGFAPLRDAARRHRATIGTWVSPWGGYDPAKQRRLEHGRRAGFETTEAGFSLAGPRYFERFRETCQRFVRAEGVRYLKLDGLSGARMEETEALFRLAAELRAAVPDLVVNVTVGTWPSPFWLWHADATWRGGDDGGFAGPGPPREQWITHRDAATYHNVVRKAPLYPLAALMTHGVVDGQLGQSASLSPSGVELTHDIRAYFGSGVALQELYITAARLKEADWDVLGEAARWARANAPVLADARWVGGDPARGEIYGWAAWSPRKAILVLRCPSDQPSRIDVDVASAFELPPGSTPRYTLRSPWKESAAQPPLVVAGGRPHTFALAPFEVLVLEATLDP